jgi:GxxExxY protein
LQELRHKDVDARKSRVRRWPTLCEQPWHDRASAANIPATWAHHAGNSRLFFKASGELGHGFSEHVLRRAMVVLLREIGLRVLEEYSLEVHFHGHVIGKFVADLIVERRVLVEVKACSKIEPYAEAQLLNYLKVAGGGVGLLLNFGWKPEFKRMVIDDPVNSLPYLNA